MAEEPRWITRARQTYAFHKDKLKSDPKWNLCKTAQALRRAIGPISEDIMIAKWLKTHEVQISRFKYQYEALAFIQSKKRDMELTD